LNQTPGQEPKKRNPLLMIGGIGCAILLCIALLAGGGTFAYLTIQEESSLSDLLSRGNDVPTAAAVETPTSEPEEPLPTPMEAVTEENLEATDESGEAETSPSPPPVEEETAPVSVEPEIGEITFALGATDDYEPIDPAELFEQGITEIHALFDYSGMSTAFTWERVWYLDGEEILRNAADWTDPETGRFDYFLDAGGDPLPPGEWDLEIYVEDELLASGSFIIEGAAEEPTPLAQAETPTVTPTSEPTETPTPRPATSSGGGGTYKLVYTKWDGGQHNMYVAGRAILDPEWSGNFLLW
jgi:predicted ribosomally synthesized peptide with SipW-like signal peptide